MNGGAWVRVRAHVLCGISVSVALCALAGLPTYDTQTLLPRVLTHSWWTKKTRTQRALHDKKLMVAPLPSSIPGHSACAPCAAQLCEAPPRTCVCVCTRALMRRTLWMAGRPRPATSCLPQRAPPCRGHWTSWCVSPHPCTPRGSPTARWNSAPASCASRWVGT